MEIDKKSHQITDAIFGNYFESFYILTADTKFHLIRTI